MGAAPAGSRRYLAIPGSRPLLLSDELSPDNPLTLMAKPLNGSALVKICGSGVESWQRDTDKGAEAGRYDWPLPRRPTPQPSSVGEDGVVDARAL